MIKECDILVIDDSNMLRNMVKFALVDGGYKNIDEAVDGLEGLNKAKAKHYDLVITDVNMPRMSGIEFVEKLRQESGYEKIPVLVLTTEKTDEMKVVGKSVGATGWIVKPFIPAQLLKAVSIVLNR